MNNEQTIARLEFLAAFFQMPDEAMLVRIYEGTTPLGDCRNGMTQPEFVSTMSIAITDMFVNSPAKRPIYPIASEFLSHESDQSPSFTEVLTGVYQSEGKVPTGYPPDHLTVLCEFTLALLGKNETERAEEFYTRFVASWSGELVSAITKRNPPTCIMRVAELIEQLTHTLGRVHQ